MELSHAPGMPSALGLVPNDPAIEQPDQMDIDMDIDLGPIDDKDILQPVGGKGQSNGHIISV